MAMMDDVGAPISADECGNWAMAWAKRAINDPEFPLELKVRLCIAAMRVEQREVGKKQTALANAEAAASGNGKFATPAGPLRIVDLGEL